MIRTIPFLFFMLFTLSGFGQDVAQTVAEDPTTEHFNQGEKAYRAGEYTEAIREYTAVLKLDPEHLNAYLQRGFCYTLNKNYEAAVKDFSAVIQRKQDHLWAYTSRGSAYNKLQQYDKAMADFDRVIQLDPKNEEAFNNRGWTKKAQGDLKGACQDWKTSQKMGNGEAKIILSNNRCK